MSLLLASFGISRRLARMDKRELMLIQAGLSRLSRIPRVVWAREEAVRGSSKSARPDRHLW